MGSTSNCPKSMAATSNGIFQGDNPVNFALPLLILQISLVLILTRTLAIFLKPFRQPRVIAEIIGGILLGPSALGKSHTFTDKIFPKKSLVVLETVADVGLIFFLFMVGLELDLKAMKKTGRQAMTIAAAGITVPFIAGVGVSVVLHNTIVKEGSFPAFLVFMGVALSITAFPVLARILAERRLLTTDVGQMAMAAAAVNDVVAWILLALAVALSGSHKSPTIAIWVLLSGLAYVIFMFLVAKPVMGIIARQAIEHEPVQEVYIAITLAGVLVAGFFTDAIGIHSIFGAFIFGLIIPKEGPFAGILIEKIEDLVTILMLPLYFATSGLKTNSGTIHGTQSVGLLVLVIMTACVGKIMGTFTVAKLYKMNVRKSLTLGFLMNTKGLVELIVLNIGKDRGVLNDEVFAIMVIMALFTTFITTPVVIALYKPARNRVPYKRRTLYLTPIDRKAADIDPELRVLACVHGMPNVHAIINVVEAARGTSQRRRPLHMYILHLLEYSERSSSIMKLQRVRRDGLPFWDKQQHEVDNVVIAFEAYGQLSKVTVRPMTAISRFDDMHEDICATAADKRVSIIILPFYKHSRPSAMSTNHAVWEGHSAGLRHVTQKVLLHAPCSVAVLVDRGIGMASFSSSFVDRHIGVLFFGGPDDREALAFGYRMAEHPGIKLSVFRFVFSDLADIAGTDVLSTDGHNNNNNNNNAAGHVALSLPSHPSGSGFSINSRFSHGGHDTFDYMVGSDKIDWAKETKMDEECLALAKSRQPNVSLSPLLSPIGGSRGGEEVLQGAAGVQIRFEERAIGASPAGVALEIARSEGLNLVIVGRGRRPSPLISAAFAGQHAEYVELGPIGEALAAAPEIQCSVLAVQQHDPELVEPGDAWQAAAVPSEKVMEVSTPPIKAGGGLRQLSSPSVVVITGPTMGAGSVNNES